MIFLIITHSKWFLDKLGHAGTIKVYITITLCSNVRINQVCTTCSLRTKTNPRTRCAFSRSLKDLTTSLSHFQAKLMYALLHLDKLNYADRREKLFLPVVPPTLAGTPCSNPPVLTRLTRRWTRK